MPDDAGGFENNPPPSPPAAHCKIGVFVIQEEIVLTEEEECVNKPEAEEPTANHGAAEAGNAGDKTPPTQGSSDTTKFYMAPNAQVMHAKECAQGIVEEASH